MTAAPGQPLRIAQVSDWFLPKFGGIEMQIARLCLELQRAGHETEIVTGTPGDPGYRGIPVHRLKVWQDPWLTMSWAPWQIESLKRVFRDGKYDVIHVHASFPSPLASSASLAARTLGLPCVVTFHSVLLKSAPYLRIANRLYDWYRGQKLTVVSKTLARQVEAAFPPHRPDLLCNGVDFGFWRTDAGRTPRDGRELRLVSTMRLNWKKRPAALIRIVLAAQKILDTRGQGRVTLTIAGDGPERKAVTSLIDRLGCGDRIKLAGVLDHEALRDLYRACDVFVLASIEEAFGIAALEARCAGLPVVTMATSGAKDFLRPGKTAFLADTDEDFARTIADLCLDTQSPLLLAADDPALRRYDWAQITEDHVGTYRATIREAGR